MQDSFHFLDVTGAVLITNSAEDSSKSF